MAMPASGTIAIVCNSFQTCSSIQTAVSSSSSGSLCALSVAAGKSAPHCMREFYSYAEKTGVNWNQYYSYGTQGSSSYVYECYCVTPTPSAGRTYSLCVRGDLSIANQGSSSYAYICVTCNNAHKMCCRITIPTACASSFGVLMTVDSNDCIRARVQACATNTSCSLCARASACIYSATGTYYCKGTPSHCYTYTG